MSKIYVRVRWDRDSMGVTMYHNNDLALSISNCTILLFPFKNIFGIFHIRSINSLYIHTMVSNQAVKANETYFCQYEYTCALK